LQPSLLLLLPLLLLSLGPLLPYYCRRTLGHNPSWLVILLLLLLLGLLRSLHYRLC
jgi:hypothetical protein